MKFIRKHRKFSLGILIFLTVFLITTLAFGRYIYNSLNNFILETKGFYFNSSVLKPNGKTYSINNWDGVNSYPFTIDVNNRKNDEVYTTADIAYNIHYECDDTVTCTLSKTSGVIFEDDHTDSYIINVTPRSTFNAGDVVTIRTWVESTEPYKKELSATYKLGIQKANFSYNIEDSANSKFLTLNLTNAITYYVVEEAFSGHAVGSQVSVEEYASLSADNKKKCYSAKVTLSFNPNILRLDMTSDTYHNKLTTNYHETEIDGYNYVDKYSFNIEASSNSKIIFYKRDITQNYTYPIVNNNSIITVDVVTAS